MKTPIKIIDRQFNFLGEIDEYESYIAVRSYFGIGSCQLVLHEDTKYIDGLQIENIIFITPDKPYVILHREVDSTDGKVSIQGLQLKSYLSRYITYPPLGQAYHRINAPAETIMKNIVTTNMAIQGISDIIVAPDMARGEQSVLQTRYKYISDEMEKIGLVSGLGWNVSLDFDSKKFVFDVVESLDRTAGQDINSRAIFAPEYDNIQEQELVESKMNYANVAIVAGQGSGADRALVQVGDTTGLDRFELFVDARDIEDAADLPYRGEEKLAEMQEIKTFETEIVPDGNLIYEEDYNIGDLVTIQNKKWNVTLDARINDITEVYETDGFSLLATFGNNIPTLMSVLKQALDAPFVDEGGGGGEQTASEIPISSGNFESTNVEGALDELFTNVSNGKGLIATAITDKGGTASGSNTFIQLATAIGNIPTGTDIETIVAGDTIVYSETNIVSTASTTYAKLREAKVLKGGSITVNFSMKTNNAYAEFTAAVFINNSRVSQEYTGNGTPTRTYSANCNIQEGDLIQLWANVSEDRWQTQNTAFSLGILLPDLGIIE